MLLLVTLLSGCSQHFAVVEEATSPIITRETSAPQPSPSHTESGRQPVILSRNPEGIYNEHSVFGHSIFWGAPELGENGYLPPYLLRIYRTIYPLDGELDVFKELDQLVNSFTNNIDPGDTFVPYLLTEESVNLTDEELHERLSAFTEAYVFSKYTDSINYRLIAMDRMRPGYYHHFMSWDYYIQVWDDNNIWAQPLCEDTEFKFSQAVFITGSDGNELVLLCGRTDRPTGSGFAVAGTGFVFTDDIWQPVQWDELFDQEKEGYNTKVSTDGFSMTYYDPYMAQAFFLPPHLGPLYVLELAEDGSFWADYSMFPEYPANENLPPKELLFRLKM